MITTRKNYNQKIVYDMRARNTIDRESKKKRLSN